MQKVRNLFLLMMAAFLISCTGLYFESTPYPLHPAKPISLQEMTDKEFWYGIVFNGEKVGFSRLKIIPSSDKQDFVIQGELYMALRFLGLCRRVQMKSEDWVKRDLSLKHFHHYQKINDGELEITGRKVNDTLLLNIKSNGAERESKIPAKSPLYPASLINLYPSLSGLSVGSEHRYRVFEPQTANIYEVHQKVTAFERAPQLGLPPSFRVETEMDGFSATTWINIAGETEMERGLGGVLITYRETEGEARKYLVEASLAKKDLAADFSLIKTERVITCPRKVKTMTATISGLEGLMDLPAGLLKRAIKEKDGILVHLQRVFPEGEGTLPENLRRLYLSSHPQIEVHHPEIRAAAGEITKGAKSDGDKVFLLTKWVANEIAPDLSDRFSALEVWKTKKGECQAHTLLYTALARAVGIPTRLAGGLVYVEGRGFLYHSWAESHVNGWIPVDPTFGQVPVDATHIKLVDGPDWASFLPLSKVMGRIKIEIRQYTCEDEK